MYSFTAEPAPPKITFSSIVTMCLCVLEYYPKLRNLMVLQISCQQELETVLISITLFSKTPKTRIAIFWPSLMILDLPISIYLHMIFSYYHLYYLSDIELLICHYNLTLYLTLPAFPLHLMASLIQYWEECA